MTKTNISFDLKLTNEVFKKKLNSLIKISEDSILEQNSQYKDLLKNFTEHENWIRISSHYTNIEWILLNSIFISAFAYFEYHLFQLSRIVEEKKSKNLIADINGRGIIKFCNYLFLVGEIASADRKKKDWVDISNYQKVRNLIVHNGGIMVSDISKQLERHECYNFLRRRNVIMAGSVGHIRIRNINFIKNFINEIQLISDNLTQEISILYPNEFTT